MNIPRRICHCLRWRCCYAGCCDWRDCDAVRGRIHWWLPPASVSECDEVGCCGSTPSLSSDWKRPAPPPPPLRTLSSHPTPSALETRPVCSPLSSRKLDVHRLPEAFFFFFQNENKSQLVHWIKKKSFHFISFPFWGCCVRSILFEREREREREMKWWWKSDGEREREREREESDVTIGRTSRRLERRRRKRDGRETEERQKRRKRWYGRRMHTASSILEKKV